MSQTVHFRVSETNETITGLCGSQDARANYCTKDVTMLHYYDFSEAFLNADYSTRLENERPIKRCEACLAHPKIVLLTLDNTHL